MDVLVNGDGNEAGADELENFGVSEARRTVEHAVVSDTAKRMPTADQHEDRLLLLGCLGLGFENGEFPRDGLPRLLLGWVEKLVQRVEVGLREALLGPAVP